MDTTQILLTQHPRDAIVMMLNLENDTNFAIDDIEVSAPTALVGTPNTEVTLSVRRSRGKNDKLPYGDVGPITFRYNRLDVAHHFNGVLGGFDTELPTSTQTLLDEITSRVGQEFVLDDIVLEDISRETVLAYRLKAKAESLRWVGEMPVVVSGVLDLASYASLITPTTLGEPAHQQRYSPVNAVLPSLNVTALQTPLRALATDVPAQEGVDFKSIFDLSVHSPARYNNRFPMYPNGYFEDGGAGWSLEGSSDYLNGDFRLIRNTLSRARIYRQLQAQVGDLIEVALELSENDAVLTGQVSLDLLSPTLQPIQSYPFLYDQGKPVTLGAVGLTHVYFIATVANPYIALTLLPQTDPTPRAVSITQFNAFHIPKRFVVAKPALTNATVTDTSGSQFVDTVLTLTSGPSRRVQLPKQLVDGRTSLVQLKVVQRGLDRLRFSGNQSALLYRDIDPSNIANGQTVSFVLNNPAIGTNGNTLNIDILQQDTWVLDDIRITPLPYASGRDLFPTQDFLFGEAFVRKMAGSESNIAIEENGDPGYIHVEQQTTTPGTVQFQSNGIAVGEAYAFKASAQKEQYRYVDFMMQRAGSLMSLQPANQTWNLTLSKRFQHPYEIHGLGRVNEWKSSSSPAVEMTLRNNNTAPDVSIGAFSTITQVSLKLRETDWYVTPIPSAENLYGAVLLNNAIPLTDGFTSIMPAATHVADVRLSPQYCTTYSHSVALLPYVDHSTMRSNFSAYPQLTRYGLSTSEDATYYREYFTSLVPGQSAVTGMFPAVMEMDVFGTGKPWTLTEFVPGPKNIFGALVQYNGPIRPLDLPPAIRGLTHVCIMYLSPDFCTGFRGMVRFYYRAA